MVTARSKQLHWIRQVRVPATSEAAGTRTEARDRLIAAVAERPRTVAQLAHTFGLAQPTVLEQVRRAVRDGLIVEIEIPEAEKRSVAERYYSPAVPVIRQADRDLLEGASRALAGSLAAAMSEHWADLQAAFATTHLAREGWEIDALWPYLHETIVRLAVVRMGSGVKVVPQTAHGLAWIQDAPGFDDVPATPAAPEEEVA